MLYVLLNVGGVLPSRAFFNSPLFSFAMGVNLANPGKLFQPACLIYLAERTAQKPDGWLVFCNQWLTPGKLGVAGYFFVAH